ncbi:hypothetical protein [Entomobacter blattae]|uniref:hypothetical protein n=1 Tax=Entomobacter blattae TaxID=2762277 RepID=UPI00193B5334|nr:hypothetical protein [Entomobacter blattae]
MSALLGGVPIALELIDKLATEANTKMFSEDVDRDVVSTALRQVSFLTSTVFLLGEE